MAKPEKDKPAEKPAPAHVITNRRKTPIVDPGSKLTLPYGRTTVTTEELGKLRKNKVIAALLDEGSLLSVDPPLPEPEPEKPAAKGA